MVYNQHFRSFMIMTVKLAMSALCYEPVSAWESSRNGWQSSHYLICTDTLSVGATLSTLPLGLNSFLLELTPFSEGAWCAGKKTESQMIL